MNRQKIRSEWQNPNNHMFIEDFAYHLIYNLGKQSSKDFFSTNQNANDNIKAAIDKGHSHSFCYDINDIVHFSAANLIMFGESFTCITNDIQNQQINLSNITFDKYKKTKNSYTFYRCSTTNTRKILKESGRTYSSKNIVNMTYPNIGLNSKQRIELRKRLSHIDLAKTTDLVIDKYVHYDTELYNKISTKELLKSTYNLRWNGRNTATNEINEYYMLYRFAKFKIAQIKMLNYIISTLNTKIAKLFEGATSSFIQYSAPTEKSINDLLFGMEKGEISFSKAIDSILSNK